MLSCSEDLRWSSKDSTDTVISVHTLTVKLCILTPEESHGLNPYECEIARCMAAGARPVCLFMVLLGNNVS